MSCFVIHPFSNVKFMDAVLFLINQISHRLARNDGINILCHMVVSICWLSYVFSTADLHIPMLEQQGVHMKITLCLISNILNVNTKDRCVKMK
jgi:hypothetical protein